jgi:hypothetical protein
MDPEPCVKFYFGSDDLIKTKNLDLTIQQARQLIQLFRVQLLQIYAVSDCGHEFDQYWPLIDCVDGKFCIITV